MKVVDVAIPILALGLRFTRTVRAARHKQACPPRGQQVHNRGALCNCLKGERR